MELDELDHGSLVLWATDCAEHVLPYFEEEHPKDDRPRNAIEAGRAWVRSEIATGEARAAAFAAHAASYAVKAATNAAILTDSAASAEERDWQYRRLPERLRPVAVRGRGDNRGRVGGSRSRLASGASRIPTRRAERGVLREWPGARSPGQNPHTWLNSSK